MLRRVALVTADISWERSASVITVTRIDELGTMLAVTSNLRTLRRNAIAWRRYFPPKRRFVQEPHRINTPEDCILHSHRRENLKSYKTYCFIGLLNFVSHHH
jgi:hypothetical protein